MRRYSLLIFLFIFPRILSADSILVLGDSLSAAYGFQLDKSWVHLLQQNLQSSKNSNHSWRVINASVSGETTAGGLARLPQLLSKHKPVLTIIALGANDGLRGQSINIMRSNLATMVQNSKEFGTVVLLGMRLPPNYGRAYTEAFEESYTLIAKQYDVRYIPFFIAGVTENPELMQADNFHPNAKAQPTIFTNIWPTIKTAVDKISAAKTVIAE